MRNIKNAHQIKKAYILFNIPSILNFNRFTVPTPPNVSAFINTQDLQNFEKPRTALKSAQTQKGLQNAFFIHDQKMFYKICFYCVTSKKSWFLVAFVFIHR